MASLTRWTWVWAGFGSWWWTGKPGMLQSMGSQRVGHDWVTELKWTDTYQKRQEACAQKIIKHKWKKSKTHKQMKRHTMFLVWQNQYCENDYTTQSKLQIQCIPYQITNGILHTVGRKIFTFSVETQKITNSQSSLEKEEWSWRNQPSWLQIILQSYSRQDSMVLAQRQKYRSMEQKQKPQR